MKKLVALSILSFSFLSVGALAAQTFKGVVTATMCAEGHGAAAASVPSHAACAKECIGKGYPAALVVGHKTLYKVSNPAKLAPFAGQTVVVKGKLDNGILTVASVKN